MEKFDFQAYRNRKRRMIRTSLIVGSLGLFIILDSGSMYPIPLTGVLALYVGGFLLVPSIAAFIFFNRPPTDRMISQLAVKTNGYILSTFLISEFDIKIEAAEQIMKRLFLQGYLDIVNKVNNDTPISHWVTIFVGASERRVNQQSGEPRNTSMDLSAHTAGNDEMTVADINNMLLNGGLHLGGSGQAQ